MSQTKKQVGDILVDAGIITVKTLERALARQKGSGRRLGSILEEMGVLTEEELMTALARQFNFKTVKDIVNYNFTADLLSLVPEDLAVLRHVFPLKSREGVLALAITDPFDTDTLDFLAKRNGLKVIPVLACKDDILKAIKKYYLQGSEQKENLLKVLVVDDTLSVATIIKVALEKEGYEVFLAHDGIEGLKLALSERPDLIVCDSVMPRLDGYGLKRAIDCNPQISHIPMILLTSKASGEDEQKALETGFLDFIPKPVQPIRIVSRVKHAFTLINNMRK